MTATAQKVLGMLRISGHILNPIDKQQIQLHIDQAVATAYQEGYAEGERAANSRKYRSPADDCGCSQPSCSYCG